MNDFPVVDAHIHLGSFPVLENLPVDLNTKAEIVAFRSNQPELFARQLHEEPVDNSNQLIRALDEHEIKIGIVMARPGVSNDDTAEMAARHPQRLRFQLRLGSDQQLSGYHDDPREARAAAPEEISRCVEKHGAIGVGEIFVRALTREIHPEAIADDLDPIMRTVIDEKIPIAFPTGWSQWKGGLYYGNPGWVDELAGRYPQAKILLTKMGRGMQSIFETVTAVCLRNRNVYVDMTHTSAEHLRSAVSDIGANRIMYGSDWSATWQNLKVPHDVHSLGFHTLKGAHLAPEDERLILSGTAGKFFGLDD